MFAIKIDRELTLLEAIQHAIKEAAAGNADMKTTHENDTEYSMENHKSATGQSHE